jgi:hypothetical protein
VHYDTDTTLLSKFIRYEHTNGANYGMINIVRRFNFWHSKNEKHRLSAVAKAGGGIVVPRTQSYIAGV